MPSKEASPATPATQEAAPTLSQSFRAPMASEASHGTPATQEALPTATTGEGEEVDFIILQPGEAEVVGRMEDDHPETEEYDVDSDDDDDDTSSQ